jgi:hypothetical protein
MVIPITIVEVPCCNKISTKMKVCNRWLNMVWNRELQLRVVDA